jgi:hypothetical protein
MNLSNAVRTAKSIITANSPVLLVGTAVAGVVTTGVLAAKGGYKARGIIDAATVDKGEELTTQEKVQLTWLCYAVPAVTGVTTIASAIGVHTIHTKRHAALAGLYAVTTTKMDDYREKAEELLGAKKTQQLNDAVAQKDADGNPIVNHEVIIVDGGTSLCFDQWSGRYFMGSIPIIEKAISDLNIQLVEAGDACLNDFYDYVGLSPIDMGQEFGWSGEKIEARFGNITASDGRPAIAFRFHQEPKENLGIRR